MKLLAILAIVVLFECHHSVYGQVSPDFSHAIEKLGKLVLDRSPTSNRSDLTGYQLEELGSLLGSGVDGHNALWQNLMGKLSVNSFGELHPKNLNVSQLCLDDLFAVLKSIRRGEMWALNSKLELRTS